MSHRRSLRFLLEATDYERTDKYYFTVTYSKRKFKLKISDGKLTEEIVEKYLNKYKLSKTLILENIWIENFQRLPQFIKKKRFFLDAEEESPLTKIFYDYFLNFI